MEPTKQFNVLGVGVDILIPSRATNNSFTISAYTTEPGGGPPPHWHEKEDEIFSVIEGEFEVFNGAEWKPIPKGDYVPALRGEVHTFRNSGEAIGKLLCISTPGGLDAYLEAISTVVMPQDAARLTGISQSFGITFVSSAPPAL